MCRRLRIAAGVALGLAVLAHSAEAQRYYYPRGYGSYGWGGWGADPAAGYMAGLGAFARGQGAYSIDAAKARSMQIDNIVKWNNVLRKRQKELREERAKADARRDAEREERVAQLELADGTTLNNLLSTIQDFDPAAAQSARDRTALSAAAVHEIPFEWNTEAISLCLDQMTGEGALPEVLNDPKYADARGALDRAVESAIKEDRKGDVSHQAVRQVSRAIADFRALFVKNVPEDSPSFEEGDAYFKTLSSLTRLLNDPSMTRALAELDRDRSVTTGDLIAFMQTYNLRFGPTTTERQVKIYQMLADRLTAVRDHLRGRRAEGEAGGENGPNADLPSVARDTFRGMDWSDLDAHSKSH